MLAKRNSKLGKAKHQVHFNTAVRVSRSTAALSTISSCFPSSSSSSSSSTSSSSSSSSHSPYFPFLIRRLFCCCCCCCCCCCLATPNEIKEEDDATRLFFRFSFCCHWPPLPTNQEREKRSTVIRSFHPRARP